MEFSGHVTEDAPDPWDEVRERVAALGIAAAGLVDQPHLEDRGVQSISESRHEDVDGPEVVEEVTLSRSYTLWRNPRDRADPVNLAVLDDATRASLDRAPARPMPAWLLEERRRMRFPTLWEAVRTHWTAPGLDRTTVADRLVAHAEEVLTNRFRGQLGLQPGGPASLVSPKALQGRAVPVDGAERPGLLLDTDPFVLALGTELADGRVVTVVVPRDDLAHVVLALRSSAPTAPAG